MTWDDMGEVVTISFDELQRQGDGVTLFIERRDFDTAASDVELRCNATAAPPPPPPTTSLPGCASTDHAVN